MTQSNSWMLDQFYQYMVVERRLADNTVESYSRDLTRFLAFHEQRGCAFADATRLELLAFLNQQREQGLSSWLSCSPFVSLFCIFFCFFFFDSSRRFTLYRCS